MPNLLGCGLAHLGVFYDSRRVALADVQPNPAHKALVELESCAQVTIVTQNVDDLHERAGSSTVLHMHGLLTRICSDRNLRLCRDIGYEPAPQHELAPDGGRWRPSVVWFGEEVHHQQRILEAVASCDQLWVIGTSLQVYPAASLMAYADQAQRIYYSDPDPAPISDDKVTVIAEKAGTAVPSLVAEMARE